MPKQTLSVSDEELKWRIDELPASTLITEQQTARILGVHPTTLSVRRKMQSERLAKAENNEGPMVADHDLLEARQEGHRRRIRYELGDVLRELKKYKYVSRQARDAAQARRESGWMGFGTWLAQAAITDTWTFTVVNDMPIDFETSLIMAGKEDWEEDAEEVQELTLGEYLTMRLRAAERESKDREAAVLEAATLAPMEGEKTCERCGRSLHSGPCRL